MAKNKKSAVVTVENVQLISVRWGETFTVPEENLGRGVSMAASGSVLKEQRFSIMLRGMTSEMGADILVTNATEEEIQRELGRRKQVMSQLRSDMDTAGTDKAKYDFARCHLDVCEYHWLDTDGKLIEPRYRAVTGNQRYSQYDLAETDRLLMVRSIGWAGNLKGLPFDFTHFGDGSDHTTLDHVKAKASDVCQPAYQVKFRPVMTKVEMYEYQYRENNPEYAQGKMSTEDRAYNLFARCVENGKLYTQTEVASLSLQKYGVAQNIFLMLRVAWALIGTGYDIFARARLDAEKDPNYRNPNAWAGNDKKTAPRSSSIRTTLDCMTQTGLDKVNRDREANQLPKIEVVKSQADLVAQLERYHAEDLAGGSDGARGLTWKQAAESAETELVQSYIAACVNNSVADWLAKNQRLINQIKSLEAKAIKDKLEAKPQVTEATWGLVETSTEPAGETTGETAGEPFEATA